MDVGLRAENRRVHVRVLGIVQGVGFRPHVYQLARRFRLNGWVCNQSAGVEIEVAGASDQIDSFIDDIRAKAPPLARIVQVEVREQPFLPLDPFEIVRSRAGQSRSTLISPDVCTCGDCLGELLDPKDRRYRYPFINCTNCGPRYTIIKDIPYDRDKTTMASFSMCPSCLKEYEDPSDRRFHAQPNGCWECGPQVRLETAAGERVAERDGAIIETVRRLEEGAIVCIKGLGGFHLAVQAGLEGSVSRLRDRKVREEKPFAVMFSDMDEVRRHCRVSAEEASLLQGLQRPIVLLERRADPEASRTAAGVAPRNRSLGAFLPYTPLHRLLFEASSARALVMTSANRSDEPIVTQNEEAGERLKDIADFFLFHDRDIYLRCDDSVARVMCGKPRPIRRARGYVPVPIFLSEPVPPVLGVGGELKSTVCLTRGNEAFLSQHIGDLENLETLRSFDHTIRHLKRILDIEPQCIVHDLHPDYLSTQWAMEQEQSGMLRLAVQHHHAHIAAVVAERRLSGPVLGLALDGTGYGPDGTIWGGELLRVDGGDFERLGHLRNVPLPGGERAIKEPWRMALSYLWGLGPKIVEHAYADFLGRWPRQKVRIVLQMLDQSLNAPLTSSCGRLFDAVSALVGLRETVTYEGQAAIELEQAIEADDGCYRGCVTLDGAAWVMDPLPMVAEVVEDLRRGRPPGIVSARFHNGMVLLLAEAAETASAGTGLTRIALSGGVFQNAYLAERLEVELVRRGLEPYGHIEAPPNDACIALGQAFIGSKRL